MKSFIDFLHQSLGITIDAAASTIITLLSVLLTVLIAEVISAIKAHNQRWRRKQALKENLINLIKGLYRQAISHEKLCMQLSIDHPGSFTYSPVSIAAMGVIPQLGYENLYNAFFTGVDNPFSKKRSRAFNSIWIALQYLNSYHESTREQVYKFEANNLEVNNIRNTALRNVIEITDQFLLMLDPSSPVDLFAFLKGVNDVRFNWQQQQDNRLPRIVEESLVQPLLELIRKSVPVLKEYKSMISSGELTMSLLDASRAYENQKNLFDGNNQQFSAMATNYYFHFNRIKYAIRTLYTPKYSVSTKRVVIIVGVIITGLLIHKTIEIQNLKAETQKVIINQKNEIDSLKKLQKLNSR